MRNRIVAAIAAAAVALGVVGIAMAVSTYVSAVVSPSDDSDTSTVGFDRPAQKPLPPAPPPTDTEVATMTTLDGYIERCMDEAGFPEYFVPNVYADDYVPVDDWDADLSEQQAAAAFVALWGDTGAGADYNWDEAGCHGYAVHMIGADNAN